MSLLLALLISLEQTHGPYARPVHGGEPAVAAARGGALLAWSEANRIRAGVLDTHGRMSETIQTLPALSERSIALAPIAASDGDSYFLAWIELEGGMQHTMGARLGEAPRRYGKSNGIAIDDLAMHLVWDGTSYHLWSSGNRFTIDRDGNLLATERATLPSGAAAADGVIGTSSGKRTLTGCGFSWCSWRLELFWEIGRETETEQIGFATGPVSRMIEVVLPPTAMAAGGGRFAVAWPQERVIHYRIAGQGGGRVSAFPEDVRPGLACDEERCIVAYSRANDIHAFAFSSERLFSPELFTVSTTERIERLPQVRALGNGRFLVVYRSDGDGGPRLSWRIVHTEPPRRRAAGLH